MAIVSVLYPNRPGTRFDMDYYTGHHLPLVRRLLEPAGLRRMGYFRPVEADPAAPYLLVATLHFDDMDSLHAALAAHGAETQADIPRFTDAVPVILLGRETTA